MTQVSHQEESFYTRKEGNGKQHPHDEIRCLADCSHFCDEMIPGIATRED